VAEEIHRRLPAGAEVVPGGTHFRVWAPQRRRVEVVLGREVARLKREPSGYWSALVGGAGPGTLYKYRLDAEEMYPDPASLFQPDGPHGSSEVIDGSAFNWTVHDWRGIGAAGQVLYELHIGTFTPEGTWSSAAAKLPFLRDTGITAIEVMPVSDFPGEFGWGYDGVHPFAPTHLYGRPDDFRAFIDCAHQLGIGVILDVVYNHLGPDGNYLGQFSKHYFTDHYQTDWGSAINFDSEECDPVRDYFIANAVYWIRDYRLDGLRFDATQNIYDESDDHILAAMSRAVRCAAGDRSVLLVAENEPQEVRIVRCPAQGGFGFDALWNDDFHHTAMVALTGHRDAYYTDYGGSPQEFISAAKYGYLYQGQWYKWQEQRRGTPSFGLPPTAFITFTQNHDQIANSAHGLRCHLLSDPGTYKAITALMLLGPGTPMLFQGQEFAASTPFFYFADHEPQLARLVREGRVEFMSQFDTIASSGTEQYVPDPAARSTFDRCKLDWSEVETHSEMYAFHRDLLRLRCDEPIFRNQKSGAIDGAVLGERAFVLRFFGEDGDDRLLVVNLGIDLCLDPAPEPLLAPPLLMRWVIQWSSEDPLYGGNGTSPLDSPLNWRMPGRATVLLRPEAAPRRKAAEKREK
jgi:maltooligosyltrehalose trehalohydrolase